MTASLLGAFVFLGAFAARAQEWSGLNVSSYGGMHAGLFNPAITGVSRYKVQVGIVGANAQLSTNMLGYTGERGVGTFFKGFELAGEAYDNLRKSSFGDGLGALFPANEWARIRNSEKKEFSATTDVRGPFLLLNQSSLSFGIGYRMRAALQLHNVSPGIADIFFQGFDNADPANLGVQLKDESFSASANAYHEFYGTVAFPILKLDRHYLGAGVTFKYLGGMYAASVQNRGLTYTLQTKDSLVTTQANVTYQYVDNKVFAANPLSARGNGAGLDFGVVYEVRGLDINDDAYETGKGPHEVRAGLSFVDLGRMFYSGNGVRRFDFNRSDSLAAWGRIDTLSVNSSIRLDSVFNRVFGARNQANDFYTGLPATINAFVDFRLYDRFYLAASATQSLTAVSKSGLRSFSTLTIIPRYESKLVEVSLPMGVGLNYKMFQPGFFARVSGFYFGSDNMATFFGASKRTGISFYAGGFVPIGR